MQRFLICICALVVACGGGDGEDGAPRDPGMETQTVSCADDPCGDGACIDTEESYVCHCPEGFGGDGCEEGAGTCANNPCGNEGLCLEGPTGYQCECQSSFSGATCEEAISLGVEYSCAFGPGGAKCWGGSYYGQMGYGDLEVRGDEPGELGSALPFIDLGPGFSPATVLAGGYHACAVSDVGQVKCWGANAFGQLGHGGILQWGDEDGEMGSDLPLTPLGAGRSVRFFATGRYHNCAVLDNRMVKCWGQNDFGQLGTGDSDYRGDGGGEMGDGLLAIPLAGPARTVTAGEYHSCALLMDGTVQCWGANEAGQLGLGDTQHRGDDPNEMGANLPLVALPRAALAVEAGGSHTCALLDDFSVSCWGGNGLGQLGQGDTGPRTAPVAVSFAEGQTPVALSTGWDHTCARFQSGAMSCWGFNADGQLGLGVAGNQDTATGLLDLGSGRRARAVSAAAYHTCAVLDDGQVKCWGRNSDGQLGLGDVTPRGISAGDMGDNLAAVEL